MKTIFTMLLISLALSSFQLKAKGTDPVIPLRANIQPSSPTNTSAVKIDCAEMNKVLGSTKTNTSVKPTTYVSQMKIVVSNSATPFEITQVCYEVH